MAKPATKETWEDARRLFECGKSLNEVNSATGIDRASISKRAKKEGWNKTRFQQLIKDSVRVSTVISTLDVETRKVVETEIDERTRYLKYFNDANLLHSDIALKKLKMDDVNISYAELNSSINVVSKAQDGIMGKQPDTAFQVNNNIDTGVTELLKRAMGTALRPPR